jgi:hypothetical protein
MHVLAKDELPETRKCQSERQFADRTDGVHFAESASPFVMESKR